MEVFAGQTPTSVTLKSSSGYMSKAAYTVKFSKPGYADQTAQISYSLDGWYFGNLLLGGVIGMFIVDPLTGAMFKLDTHAVNATMNPSLSTTETPTLKIIDINEISEEQKQHLVRVN